MSNMSMCAPYGNSHKITGVNDKFGVHRDFAAFISTLVAMDEYERQKNPQYQLMHIETIGGITRYIHSNAHYIVDRSEVHTAYGYHGDNLFKRLIRQNAERSIARQFWIEYRNRLIDELEAMRDLGISMNDPRYEHVYLINYDVCDIAWNPHNFTLPGLLD